MPQFTLYPPKPIGLNYNLTNPYAQPKPINTGIVSTNFYQKPPALGKPVTVGNVRVDTTKPVIVQGDTKTVDVEKEKEVGTKVGFWASKTKKQKILIATGAVVVVALSYLLLKRK